MNVKELLLKLPEAIDLDQGAPNAVIQFETSEPVYHVVESGAVQAHEGQAPTPDVAIKISDDNLDKLLRGELNPMTAMFTGKLRVKGNVALAQRLIGMIDRSKLEAARAQVLADENA
ncbi:MAG: SCP2 sterol-binding domain-containing protein [Trueperaceae bacterium]